MSNLACEHFALLLSGGRAQDLVGGRGDGARSCLGISGGARKNRSTQAYVTMICSTGHRRAVNSKRHFPVRCCMHTLRLLTERSISVKAFVWTGGGTCNPLKAYFTECCFLLARHNQWYSTWMTRRSACSVQHYALISCLAGSNMKRTV